VVLPATIPNDLYYSLQWHLAKINAAAAWDITKGIITPPIAIIDSRRGFDASRYWAPKFVAGWNFVSGTSNTSDVLGHGTAVAGSTLSQAAG
jgi:hypothetical protein